jgi:P27 family predicted phage terminase small subunit
MGSPGRKPKHPHLKLVDGNPGKRPIPETIPVVVVASIRDVVEPDWKEWFPVSKARVVGPQGTRARKVASLEWRRIAPELVRYRLLTALDLGTLADYCVCIARIDQGERILSRDGLVVMGERGIVRHPVTTLLNQYRAAVKAYGAEFGLGLSSRGRLKLPVTSDDEPGADLLD